MNTHGSRRPRAARKARSLVHKLGTRFEEYMASDYASVDDFLAATSGPATVATMLQSIAGFDINDPDPRDLVEAKRCGRRFTATERELVAGGFRR